MKLSLDSIIYNLNLLEEVKKDFPILQDYQDGKIRRETLNNVGLDSFISLIDYINSCNEKGLKIVYTETIKYKYLKTMFIDLNYNEKSKKIFGNKSKSDFEEMWNNHKLHHRYKRSSNECYAPGLEAAEPLIFNYLVQNNIEVNSRYMFYHSDFWFDKFTKPKYYSRELKVTQDFIQAFISYAKESNLDLRKCNVKSLTSELQDKLKKMSTIEEGLRVKCIAETPEFTIDNIYTVHSSHINYLGFVEINLITDGGQSRNVPYSNFEEISRQRDDLLSQLGI